MENKDLTKGTEPMLGARPTVTITDSKGEEKVYQMRSLGIQDTFKLAQIIAKGAGYAGELVKNMTTADGQTIAMLLLAGLPFAENESINLLASVIGVKPDEIRNPEQFPIGSEVDIIFALTQHQDLLAFFSKLKRLIQNLPQMKGLLSEQ